MKHFFIVIVGFLLYTFCVFMIGFMFNNLTNESEKKFEKTVSPLVTLAKEKIEQNVIDYAERAIGDIVYRKIFER